MTEEEIAQDLLGVLRAFTGRILARLREVPLARCGYDGVDVHGVRSPYVEFYLAGADDHLYLMFFVGRIEQGIEIRADFGRSAATIKSLPVLKLPDSARRDEVALVLERAREFVAAQEDRAEEEIRRSQRR